jgi:Zn-dependent metalloprotease
VLERFAKDAKLTDAERGCFENAAKVEANWRRARQASAAFARTSLAALPVRAALGVAPAAPTVSVFDCGHGISLPGNAVSNPGSFADQTAKRAFQVTTEVANFYNLVFGRRSLDNAGMSLLSSIHYSVGYNNAFWNGTQMTYGDGDGNIFIDFTASDDVIAHELTHGVTQFTLGLNYTNQPGGLNESMSDVFGSMFRQWRAKQKVGAADWLIGKDIMGPGAVARGFTCLRDMANPGANHCLSPQPNHFSRYQNGMDPHESSGIPNQAFYNAAMAIGGNSWEKAGKVWYAALTQSPPSPSMKMNVFANRTRTQADKLFPADLSVKAAIDAAWKSVGL